jgi:hypothetical protein
VNTNVIFWVEVSNVDDHVSTVQNAESVHGIRITGNSRASECRTDSLHKFCSAPDLQSWRHVLPTQKPLDKGALEWRNQKRNANPPLVEDHAALNSSFLSTIPVVVAYYTIEPRRYRDNQRVFFAQSIQVMIDGGSFASGSRAWMH